MTKTDGTAVFACLGEAFETLKASSANTALKDFLTVAGVDWHEGDDPWIVASPSVRIVALGGIPFVRCGESLALASSPEITFDLEAYRAATEDMMAYAGMMSYLNSGRKKPGQMFANLRDRNELSVAHTITVSLLVAGVSVAAENEFNSQRDLVHLSRVTVARSVIQSNPPLVSRSAAHVPAFREVWETAVRARSAAGVADRDDLELVNTLFPAAKATAFILTSSLRNLTKLLHQEEDHGKEREYRSILSDVREALKSVWPGLF